LVLAHAFCAVGNVLRSEVVGDHSLFQATDLPNFRNTRAIARRGSRSDQIAREQIHEWNRNFWFTCSVACAAACAGFAPSARAPVRFLARNAAVSVKFVQARQVVAENGGLSSDQTWNAL